MASFIQRLYVGEGKLVLHLSAVLDEYGSVFLIDLVAHGGHHRLVLGKGGESVLSGSLHILVCLLFPVGSQYLVNGFLRASALVVVYNLPAVGCDARGDDVQVGVVGVIVGIDKQRLSGFRIAHFPEILVGELQQLGFRLLVSLAGYGHMELRLLYPAVPGGIFPEILDQFIGGGSTKCSECPNSGFRVNGLHLSRLSAHCNRLRGSSGFRVIWLLSFGLD